MFVLTHHARAPVAKENGTTYNFVTDELGAERPKVELTRVLSSPGVAHLRYRVVE